MTTPVKTDWALLAEHVDRFEEARRASPVCGLDEFLPDSEHPLFSEVAAELVRVDLEYEWQSDSPKPLSSYRHCVPDLFDNPALLASAAYEEYRQRRLAGESVAPKEYADEYGIDTGAWPTTAGELPASLTNGDAINGDAAGVVAFPKPGDEFAGFQLVEQIGRGAFSRVYLAEQGDLAARQVALKVTTLRTLEPQHLARLQHTNIVPIYSVHERQDLLAICMPYFGSRTLADLIRGASRSDSLPESGREFLDTAAVHADETLAVDSETTEPAYREPLRGDRSEATEDIGTESSYVDTVLSIVADTAAGLRHAHERGIVHRDVKPANILITNDGQPMLLDFNLSEDLGLTRRESLVAGGTLPYMAPEHLLALQTGGQITPQSDIYSLGVILFELLAGRRPYRDPQGDLDKALDTMIAERNILVPTARMHNRSVPPSVDAIVRKCLHPELKRRYQSIAELEEDFRCHFDNLPLVHAPNPSLPERVQKWRRRHSRLVSASSLAVVAATLLLAFGVLWMARGRHVAQLEATAQFQQFGEQLPGARMALSLPDADVDLIRQGIAEGIATANLYSSNSSGDWREDDSVELLSSNGRAELGQQLAELYYLLARGEAILAKHAGDSEPDPQHLERAIAFNELATRSLPPGQSSPGLQSQKRALSRLAGLDVTDEIPDESSTPIDVTGMVEAYIKPQRLVASRSFAEASPLIEQLRNAHPTDPVPWLLAGRTEAGLGRLLAAESCYTAAIAMQPESFMGYYNRGVCRVDLKDFGGALADFDTVLDLQPNLTCALLNRAIAHEKIGQFRQALGDLDTAMSKGSFPSRAYFLRARVKEQLGDAAGAEKDRAAGIAEVPSDELSWVARGFARLKDDPKGALADFRQALILNPNSRTALKNVVHVTADRLDQPTDALWAFDEWLAIDPNNASALVGRAVVHARLGRRDDAIAGVREAMKNSQKPILMFQAACALSLTAEDDNGDAAGGLLMLSRSIELDPRLLARAATDPDLANLRQLPEYAILVESTGELMQLKRSLMKTSRQKSKENP